MRLHFLSIAPSAVLLVASAAAQVTGGGTSGTIPVFTGSSTIGNSSIAVSGGNVGIGTTNPYSPLTVQTSQAWNGISLFDGSGQVAFLVNDGTGGAQLGLQNISDNRYVQLDTNGPSFFDGGNVGIGISGPRTILDIVGSNATLDIDSSTGNAGTVGVQLLHNDGGTSQEKVAIFSQAVGQWGRGNLIFALDGSNDTSNVSPANAVMTLLDGGNVGIGTTAPGATLEVNGSVKLTSGSGASMTYADGTTQTTAWTGVLCGGDYAEEMRASGGKEKYGPGDVLVLATGDADDVRKSAEPYSTMVAGIFATRPGVIGRREEVAKSAANIPMAMVGVVPTKVSAENGPIRKGDLLVTSSTPGYAMKGTDRGKMLGAVIGKAMGSLDSGAGTIEVLVTLQ